MRPGSRGWPTLLSLSLALWVANLAAEVTTLDDDVSQRLNRWYAEGSAAGNHGDLYDNRDREHSLFPVSQYPQLRRVFYLPHEVNKNLDWRAQSRVVFTPVFGNTSMASSPQRGGSLPRIYYNDPNRLQFLHNRYRFNNLYVYPEHQDHDPAPRGFGDLYPTNTPYVLISQGSSGSDQPFLHAIAKTLAAFHPHVKATLARLGFLAPTVQKLLRRHNSVVSSREDYLSGIAHPTVFSEGYLDVSAMVNAAHRLTVDDIPPLARLRLLSENRLRAGVDYFEPSRLTVSESLASTPQLIARVARGIAYENKVTVTASAEDVNGHSLKRVYWTILRGQAERIQIETTGQFGETARISVGYHSRFPVAPGAALTSTRVDIGVFVETASGISPPSLVTFYHLPSEERRYNEKKQLIERRFLGHGTPPGRASPYSDRLFTAKKYWRDVFNYGDDGSLTGWTRTTDNQTLQFDADGNVVDASGKVMQVAYELNAQKVLEMRVR
ncbi:MAG: hypothetical protein AAF493_03610 [Pseudomonadota bacterium]